MSEELKPCPFCDKSVTISKRGSSAYPTHWARCLTGSDCPGFGIIATEDQWNTRPIEDRLRAENEILRKAVEFYADKENWQTTSGHSSWAWALKTQDCAYFNTGGGRARAALAQVAKIEKGE